MNELKSIQRYFIMNTLPLIENQFGKMIHEIKELEEPLRQWQDHEITNVVFMQILSNWLDKKDY